MPIRGQVSGLQQRFEPARTGSVTVWSFRLERVDEHGHPLARVPVEMRGYRFDGSVNNGDVVEVDGMWTSGEIMRPARVRNLSTGATVVASGSLPGRGRRALRRIVVFVIFVTILAVGISTLLAIRHSSDLHPSPRLSIHGGP